MFDKLFNNRLIFTLEMPVIGWIALVSYVGVDIVYRVWLIGRVMLGSE